VILFICCLIKFTSCNVQLLIRQKISVIIINHLINTYCATFTQPLPWAKQPHFSLKSVSRSASFACITLVCSLPRLPPTSPVSRI